MVDMAALNCLKAERSGKPFAHGASEKLHRQSFGVLAGVGVGGGGSVGHGESSMHVQECERRKVQALIHNALNSDISLNLTCKNSRVSMHTGRPHLS